MFSRELFEQQSQEKFDRDNRWFLSSVNNKVSLECPHIIYIVTIIMRRRMVLSRRPFFRAPRAVASRACKIKLNTRSNQPPQPLSPAPGRTAKPVKPHSNTAFLRVSRVRRHSASALGERRTASPETMRRASGALKSGPARYRRLVGVDAGSDRKLRSRSGKQNGGSLVAPFGRNSS